MKRIVWLILAAGASAAVSALTIRLMRAAWERVAHEPPPEPGRFGRIFAGTARRRVEHTLEPTAL